jgi:hypothetical protein
MESTTLKKTSTDSEIKIYFQRIFELKQTGDPYPINLDEVWPLVYKWKKNAVKDLTEGGLQGVDYQFSLQKGKNHLVFTQKGNNTLGGRPSEIYKLSIPCMEWLIARKIRPVFEVYRQVFHRVAEQKQLPNEQRLMNEIKELQSKQVKQHNDIKFLKSAWLYTGLPDFISDMDTTRFEIDIDHTTGNICCPYCNKSINVDFKATKN